MMIKGSLVAIVTPMHDDGSLDLDRYRALIDWHIESGTAAIVAVGTTGESPTVSVEEHQRTDPGRGGALQGQGAGHRRHGRQFHARGDRADAARQGSRRPGVPCRSCRTTTGRPRKACTGISRPSPKRRACRSSSTTCRRAPWRISPPRPSCGWPRCRASSGLKDATGDMYRGSELLATPAAGLRRLQRQRRQRACPDGHGLHGVISVTANVAPTRDGADVPGGARR